LGGDSKESEKFGTAKKKATWGNDLHIDTTQGDGFLTGDNGRPGATKGGVNHSGKEFPQKGKGTKLIIGTRPEAQSGGRSLKTRPAEEQ